jgi:hypothetical protein
MEPRTRRAHGTGRVFRMKGGDIWWIQYYVNGRQVRGSSGGTNERAAEKLLLQRLGQKAAGIHPELRRLTYDDLRLSTMPS